jgi:KRAB domain-containing zinc finger protein
MQCCNCDSEGLNCEWHKKSFLCTFEQCQKMFSRSSSLSKHLKVHLGDRPYACSTCESSFTDKSNLVRHERTIHEMLKPYSCTVCSKTFSTRSNLGQHESIHGPRAPVECPVKGCHKAFLYKSGLRKHETAHKRICEDCECMDESCSKCVHPLVCHIRDCRQEFEMVDMKQAHEREHAKEFECASCLRRFTTQFNLKKHR